LYKDSLSQNINLSLSAEKADSVPPEEQGQIFVLTSNQLEQIFSHIEDLTKKYNTILARLDGFGACQNRLDTRIEMIELGTKSETPLSPLTLWRLNELDEILLKRGEPVSFSDIGKLLELGNKKTRRQIMNQFAKILRGLPDRYRITKAQRGNQRFVSLRSEHARALKI